MNIKTGKQETPAEKKEKKSQKIKKKISKRKTRMAKGKPSKWLLILPIVLLIAVIAAVVYFFVFSKDKEQEVPELIAPEITQEILPEIVEESSLGEGILNHIITAGNAVSDAYQKRPETHELTDENRSNFATITECIISPETGLITVTAEGDGIPKSDDKYYYLFAMNTYDSAPHGDYVKREYKDNTATFTASVNYNLSGSRLYKKFAVAVKINDEYVIVSTPQYITNPEALARYSSVYQQPASKKGLLIDPNKLCGSELDDLGVKQAAYNIPIARLLGPTTSAAYPTIQYTYNGKTYTINGQVVAEYDLVFSTLTAKGMTTTAIILNNYSPSYSQLIHPKARGGSSCPYYMFNGAEESGVDYMAAIGTFLAERYSDNKHGKVANWIIANEINARKEWNYMEYTDIETYVEEYAKAFRVFYTAIKSVSSSARVYISIDQQWDRNIKNNTNYDGRDILDVFNRNITSKGNIDWGVAQHPYNVPLTEARIWKASKYVKHSANTSMISMANIEVLVNYMKQENFRAPNGEVRSILLSEQGYTSTGGEANQAAAFAYAYYKVEAYPEIDGFLLNRQTDAPEEVAQGLAFGLNNTGGGRKMLYDVFKYIDTPEHAEHTEFAKSIIGISSWSEIIY